jgi:CRP-like cAMP-binding protein
LASEPLGPSQHIFEREVTPLSVSADEAIYSEGEAPNSMYVVQSGEVELKVRGESLEVVGPDGFFGEMALPDQSRRTATAVAKTDCTIIPIS